MRTVASSNFASLEVGYELLRCVKTLPKTQQIWKDQIAHEWPKRLVQTLSKDILILLSMHVKAGSETQILMCL